MRIKPVAAGLIAALIILGGIFITKLGGIWATQGTKSPRLITAGTYAGQRDPADIRGSFSFGTIADNFGIPADVLAALFSLSPDAQDPRLYLARDLEEAFGDISLYTDKEGEIGTDSIRWFAALFNDFPYAPEESTLIPTAAAEYLQQEGKIDAEEAELLAARLVDLPETGTLSASAAPPPAVGEQEARNESSSGTTAEDRTIKGRTTFSEIYGWGVSENDVIRISGIAPGPGGATLRDYYAAEGLEYGPIRTALQALIDTAAR